MPTPRRGETRQEMNDRLRKNKIIAGMEDAVAFARGDKRKGKATIVEVNRPTHASKARPIPDTIDFARGRWSASTRRNYKMWWGYFVEWCKTNNRPLTLPTQATEITAYVQYRSEDLKAASLTQIKSAIVGVNDLLGFDVKLKGTEFPDAWAQIRRDKGTRSTPKTPLMGAELAEIIPQIESVRDCAILMLGFGLALRRSEIVALDVEDLAFSPEGVRVTIRRSKTDQEGKGTVLRMPRTHTALCPVAALETHIEKTGITEGPLFLSHSKRRLGADTVALLVKKAVALIGKDPTTHSGHSMRRGFVTTAFENGAPPESIRDRTRHQSMDMLLKYREAAQVFNSPVDIAVWKL